MMKCTFLLNASPNLTHIHEKEFLISIFLLLQPIFCKETKQIKGNLSYTISAESNKINMQFDSIEEAQTNLSRNSFIKRWSFVLYKLDMGGEETSVSITYDPVFFNGNIGLYATGSNAVFVEDLLHKFKDLIENTYPPIEVKDAVESENKAEATNSINGSEIENNKFKEFFNRFKAIILTTVGAVITMVIAAYLVYLFGWN